MVKIRPKVAMFGAFSRLNYKPWFALAEFVDNSVQSFLANRAALERYDGRAARLKVTLTIEDNRIVIHDTAAGIRLEDFPRAFVPAQPPPDASGLSEFGLGMKAAACWFAKRWAVRTSAVDDGVERQVEFDVPHIVANDIEDLDVSEVEVPKNRHYTVITLDDLNQKMKGRTVAKVKSHLASIYRAFLAEGIVSIEVNGESLDYKSPPVLVAPFNRTPTADPVEWKKSSLNVVLDESHRVTGWAALRAKASTAEAGFAVFRRGRVVLGSGDAPYRPERIFRKSNSYTYQRLFGELHVEGFDVSHTKDGLQWEEWEDDIVAELRTQLDAEPLKLLTQAEEYRVRGLSRMEDDEDFGADAATHTVDALHQHAGPVVSAQLSAEPEPESMPPESLPEVRVTTRREVTLDVAHDGRRWRVVIELSPEPGIEDWYTFSRRQLPDLGISELTVRLAMSHPFTERFALRDHEDFEPLLRIAAGLALAESAALDVGISKRIRTLRTNFNQLLRLALSK